MSSQRKNRDHVPYEFHIALDIREKYQMHALLFGTDGRVVFADFAMVRQFVFIVNQGRTPEQHLYPGEVNAAGLLDEVYHLLLRHYEEFFNPGVFSRLRRELMESEEGARYRTLLLDFIKKFPPLPVYQGKVTPLEYLEASTHKRPNLEVALEELMMLYFSNINPANLKMREFFDEKHLQDPELFRETIDRIDQFFRAEENFGPNDQDMFSLLRAPLEAAPDDLNAQLEFILTHWKSYLPETITVKVLGGLDLMREDVHLGQGAPGPGPTRAPQYKGEPGDAEGFTIGKSGYNYVLEAGKDYEEYEHFTDDTHWMPRVVMMAKNTYVWLDQLSKKYQREIRRLDQVPDQELDQLAGWNINGLWLIGIWERSSASRRIKHIMGNTDAVSSAYSLYDYEIAADLGGDQAFDDLNHRARERGIRLAGDMVPNHTGIFSRWVVEKPDYFIQAPTPPFPGYQFTGEDLSPDERIQIRLEDGYYNHTDASVVFQRIDNHSGQIRYMYHGNDGTMMAWNDTAQLDFLKQEVREAVIQKIFDVARKFSIIRFDAAMTLAKKHFARLWYPRPGSGGDIASRADYAMPQSAFDEMFPVEFWREVVDRINREMPETLLLAEAFWFMEGYFVRTLGMHRVYNSAFMHMLKNEENVKYRDLITNTLEFEPEILKRYVNFMSNPDEETAIRQFGTGDKYFGICVLMNTLPGLPMFGHGQVEGYTEKYGMEYQRAYYDELPNQWLVDKHEREIFPLTAKRYIFSEVEHFNFFDFIDDHGELNENVMAYTNRQGEERALILFNNKYESTSGHISTSAPKQQRNAGQPRTVPLAEALLIKPDEKMYYIFREHIGGQEYLLTGRQIHQEGFHWHLQGFEYRVFWNIRELYDYNGEVAHLYHHLAGKGVPDIEKALAEIRLQPIHELFEAIFDEPCIDGLVRRIVRGEPKDAGAYDLGPAEARFELFVQSLHSKKDIVIPGAIASFKAFLQSVADGVGYHDASHPALSKELKKHQLPRADTLLVAASGKAYRENIIMLLACACLRALEEPDKGSPETIEALKLQWPLEKVLKKTGFGVRGIHREMALINILIHPEASTVFDFSHLLKASPQVIPSDQQLQALSQPNTRKLLELLETEPVKNFLNENQYKEVWYYSRENFEELLHWLFSMAIFKFFRRPDQYNESSLQYITVVAVKYLAHLKDVSLKTGYQVRKLRETLLKW